MAKDKARLDTWKEIAEYLKKDVRTVIRWEKERGLPVHRMPGLKRSSVYAWTSEIDVWLGSENDTPLNGRPVAEVLRQERRLPTYAFVGAVLTLSVLAVTFQVSTERPRLGNPVPITSDGHEKGRMAITGTSLFYTLEETADTTMMRLDLNTGKQSRLPIGFRKFDLLDVSQDDSKLLVIEERSDGWPSPVWVVPVTGGHPWRLAGLSGIAAAWSPDGQRLAFSSGTDLYFAGADGTKAKPFARLPYRAGDIRWSPDGKILRLTLSGPDITDQTWEVSAHGSVRRLVPGWLDYSGRWTHDGSFFVFPAFHSGGFGLWALRENSRFAALLDRGPFQLTSSLNGVNQPALTKDGKKLFAIFTHPDRGELMRYEPGVGRFVAFPQSRGLSGGQTSFSPDGKQIAYIKYPEMSLWTMKADGSDQRQLSEKAALPQWSPDGQRIAYMGWDKEPNSPSTIRIIPSDGGSAQEPVPAPAWQGAPNWTPDEKALIFGENGARFPIAATARLHRFDFETRKRSALAGSEGLWTARVCPTGRYVAALTLDYRKLVLYDLRTSKRSELASFPDSTVGENPSWSNDGKWLYFDSPFSPQPAIYRISIPERRMEKVASLAGIPRVHGRVSWWIGLTPNNLPLILRDVHSQEIYSMDWIAP